MKNAFSIVSLLASLFTAQTVTASIKVNLECQSYLPKGKVQIFSVEDPQSTVRLHLNYEDPVLNEVYSGVLRAVGSSDSYSAGGLVAEGTLHTPTTPLRVTVQGSLTPGNDGIIRLTIHEKSWDHRIDFGYGNFLSCKQIP